MSTLTRQVIFAPLEDAGRTEMVVSRIRSAISLGLFADGEQLPNEIALAAQLAVSPVTLRDALRIVREEGLVRTQRGRNGGTFVVAPRESNIQLFENAVSAVTVIELRDLIDWQATVICQAAHLATDRALEREIEAMRLMIEPLGGAIDAIGTRRLYSRFLIELSASARSSRISKAAISLQVEYGVLSTLIFRGHDNRSRLFGDTSAVLDAISARDAAAARDRMGRVIAWMGERIQEIRHEITHRDPVGAERPEGGGS